METPPPPPNRQRREEALVEAEECASRALSSTSRAVEATDLRLRAISERLDTATVSSYGRSLDIWFVAAAVSRCWNSEFGIEGGRLLRLARNVLGSVVAERALGFMRDPLGFGETGAVTRQQRYSQ